MLLVCDVLCSSMLFYAASHRRLVFSFFQDGLKTADKLKQYIEKLATDLSNVSIHLLLRSVKLKP